jgi:hypothetical protein
LVRIHISMNSLAQSVKETPREIGPIAQMMAELENQTRCMDNAIGSLEQRLSDVLGPVPPSPGASQPPSPAASGYSPMRDVIKSYAEILQSFTNRINSIRERVEC